MERAESVGPELGEEPRPHIVQVLEALGIERRLGTTVDTVGGRSATLSSGETVPAAITVWTVGMTTSPLTASVPGETDRIGRLVVDAYLQVKTCREDSPSPTTPPPRPSPAI